jgi:hypothetical protein
VNWRDRKELGWPVEIEPTKKEQGKYK